MKCEIWYHPDTGCFWESHPWTVAGINNPVMWLSDFHFIIDIPVCLCFCRSYTWRNAENKYVEFLSSHNQSICYTFYLIRHSELTSVYSCNTCNNDNNNYHSVVFSCQKNCATPAKPVWGSTPAPSTSSSLRAVIWLLLLFQELLMLTKSSAAMARTTTTVPSIILPSFHFLYLCFCISSMCSFLALMSFSLCSCSP